MNWTENDGIHGPGSARRGEVAWNLVPGTKKKAANCVVAVSAMYTPIEPCPNMPLLPYAASRCRTCRSVLNPFPIVDFSTRIWICPFCFNQNHFPPQYSSISEDNLPAELFPNYTTIEYAEPQSSPPLPPPPLLFAIDACIIEEEMTFLKSALSQTIHPLPDNSLVGFITFGTFVHVHELGFSQTPKSYVFTAPKDVVSKDQLLNI